MYSENVKSIRLLLFTLLMILFSIFCFISCEYYNSPYPITKHGERELNKSILGNWVSVPNANKKDSLALPASELSIYPWDDHNYLVIEKQFRDQKLDLESVQAPRRIWNSIIDSLEFINCHYLGHDTVFYYYQYHINKDTLKLTFLTDSFKYKANSSEDLHNYITQNIDSFMTCFSKNHSFVRWENIPWNTVYPLKISKIFKINLLPKIIDSLSKDSLDVLFNKAFSKIEKSTIPELLEENCQLIENTDSLVFTFRHYHLWREFNREDDETIPECFIIRFENGHQIKFFKIEEGLLDLTNKLFFKKSKVKSKLVK